MILATDSGGWIAVPTWDFRSTAFDYQRHTRVTEDGRTEVYFTLTPLTAEQAAAIRAEETRLYGPPSDCDGLDQKISRSKAREAARAYERGERAAATPTTLRVVP
ncbi:MAG: hypothetical protein AB7O74_04490 [Candidatus Nanopelagicales bacterium]